MFPNKWHVSRDQRCSATVPQTAPANADDGIRGWQHNLEERFLGVDAPLFFCSRPTYTVFAFISQGGERERERRGKKKKYFTQADKLKVPLLKSIFTSYEQTRWAVFACGWLCAPCTPSLLNTAEDTWDGGQSLAGQSWRVLPFHGVPSESICFACLCSKYSRAHRPSPAHEQVFLPGAAALCSTNAHLPDVS